MVFLSDCSGELGISLEFQQGTQGSFKLWWSPLEFHWGRSSRSDVAAGSCLVAICGTLLSSCGVGITSVLQDSTVYLWWVSSSLVVTCRLLSSFGRGAFLPVVVGVSSCCVVGLLSSFGKELFLNCVGYGPSLAVM